ncbi:MAG TPA: succinate dehydrogenase cytochrome b subunit [Proteobacteria bacterium]|nr:succinate dehydrogenase/Fumarate reductase transmembrane subunit [bacterium BMS3Abin14]HDL52821.1 succinate dehydrogenase cytochrome b subunit [Pseudomonadota bacterium]
MSMLTSSVGRKMFMAVSGLFMLLFVVAHLLGNSTIFVGAGWLNAYAEHLRSLPILVWPERIIMFVLLCLHIYFGITLTLENWGAKGRKYAVTRRLKATFAGRTMIWTGLVLLAFIIYHLLQFTFRVTPDIVQTLDAEGRYDVFNMVVSSLRVASNSAIYLVAVVALFLHLYHGAESFLQTLGLNNDRTRPRINAVGIALSVLFLVGYGAIPVLILAGILAR